MSFLAEPFFNTFNYFFGQLTTAPVEFDRYDKNWYEVMRMPTSFQPDYTSSTAEYVVDSNRVRVINTSYSDADFQTKIGMIEGYAVPYTNEQGRFSVSFPSNIPSEIKHLLESIGIKNLDFPAPYWVLHTGSILTNQSDPLLNGKYESAVVSSPGRGFCWVLSREKPVADTYLKYIPLLKELGFSGKKFIMSYDPKKSVIV